MFPSLTGLYPKYKTCNLYDFVSVKVATVAWGQIEYHFEITKVSGLTYKS